VPHRQFVLTPSLPAQSALAGQPSGLSVSSASQRARLTIPRVLRGIFSKRRDLLGVLFQTAHRHPPEDARLQDGSAELAERPRRKARISHGQHRAVEGNDPREALLALRIESCRLACLCLPDTQTGAAAAGGRILVPSFE
jgi:hypothetical protein